jgi:PrcB C-terminal
MKKILCFLFFAIFISGLSGCSGESKAQISPPESQFVVLNTGGTPENGKFTKKQTKTISSPEDYAAELAIYTDAAPAQLDFTKGRVLLTDMGGRNTGGHAIGVMSVDITDNSAIANITLVIPGPGCVVTLALTNPYQFVFIPSLKEILVSEKLEVRNC